MPYKKTVKQNRFSKKRISVPESDALYDFFISTRDDIRRRMINCKTINAVDFETITDMNKGPRPYHGEDHIFAWQRCDENGEVEKHFITPGVVDPKLQSFMDDTRIAKVAHNFKFELSMLLVDGYRVPKETVWHDSQILSQFNNNLRIRHALDYVAYEISGWDMQLDKDVHRLAKKLGGFHRVPRDLMLDYQDADVQRSMMIFKTFWPKVNDSPKLRDDYINEIELIKTTEYEESKGLLLDTDECTKLIYELEKEVEDAYKKITVATGDSNFNPSSDPDMRWYIYKKLGCPVLKRTKKSQQPAVDREVLQELEKITKNPIFREFDRWRAYSKGLSMISGYEKVVDSGGFVHPSIKTNHAKTSREACENPNLQNVSKGRSNKTDFVVPARRVWRARPGHVLVFYDESGIELRLIIEASQDKNLAEVQRLADIGKGPSPHLLFCESMYGKKFHSKKKNPELYDSGKNGHFALWYGANIKKLAATVQMSVLETKPGMEKYCGKFPMADSLATSGTSRVRETGKITTGFGRDLYVEEQKPYAWLNIFIQGTAAGIIKRGQNQSWWAFQKRWGELIYPVMTIHDEIIFDVPIELWQDPIERAVFIQIVTVAMTRIEHVNVPLDVEGKMTYGTWDQTEEI